MGLAEFAKQVEILHIARAYLEAVDVRQHGLDLRDFHDFAHDCKTVSTRRFAHQFEPGNAESLKGIRRATRLVSASTQKCAACRLDASSDLKDLLTALDRARPRDDCDLMVADLCAVGELDNGAFGPKRTPG
jgi:hypothetical protein